jgi:molybdopterin converting factor small subunit
MTIKVTVKFHATFYPTVKTDSIDLTLPERSTLCDALSAMEKKFGKDFAEHTRRLDYLIIFVNNTEYRQLQGSRTALHEGDILTLGHVVAGG